MCTYLSTNDECQYLTQQTSCMGPSPYICQCQPGKYYNCENQICSNKTYLYYASNGINTQMLNNSPTIQLCRKLRQQ